MRSWHMAATVPISANLGWRDSTRSVRYGHRPDPLPLDRRQRRGLVPDAGGHPDGAEPADERGTLDQCDRRRPARRSDGQPPPPARRRHASGRGTTVTSGPRSRRRPPAPRSALSPPRDGREERSPRSPCSMRRRCPGPPKISACRRSHTSTRSGSNAPPALLRSISRAAGTPPTRQNTSASLATCTTRITGSICAPLSSLAAPLPSQRSNVCSEGPAYVDGEPEPIGDVAGGLAVGHQRVHGVTEAAGEEPADHRDAPQACPPAERWPSRNRSMGAPTRSSW